MQRRPTLTTTGLGGRHGGRRDNANRGFGPAAARAAVLSVLVLGLMAGCRSASSPETEADPVAVDPRSRSVAVVTTGCGHASATVGSGVALDQQLVLTAAHVVIGSDQLSIVVDERLPASRVWPDFSPVALFDRGTRSSVVAVDPERDLALISVAEPSPLPAELDGIRPTLTDADNGQAVVIHGSTRPEPIEGVVAERTVIVADEVGGQDRVRRLGYRLEVETAEGDSGAGIWFEDGRLVGMVFAVSTEDRRRSWAVAGSEISAFLDDLDSGRFSSDYRCDTESSKLMASTEEG